MQKLTVFLALCAITTAMVLKERREVTSENISTAASTTTTAATTPKTNTCRPQTPCAWSTYKPGLKIIEVNLTNNYCVCSPDTVCQVNEDDSNAHAYVYRCRPPNSASEDIFDS